jgi:hypothetical protein
MPTTYDPAPPDVLDLLAEVRAEYHPDLDAAGVTIGVLMASNRRGGAVKVGGHAAAAAIRVTNLRDRAQGMPDCSLLIDADRWDGLEDGERRALLDHELCHPVPRPLPPDPDAPGPPLFLLDDAGRPKLSTRKDDWCLTGFAEIVERHGRDALEAQAVRSLAARFRQELFPWGDDQAPPGVPLARRGATA